MSRPLHQEIILEFMNALIAAQEQHRSTGMEIVAEGGSIMVSVRWKPEGEPAPEGGQG